MTTALIPPPTRPTLTNRDRIVARNVACRVNDATLLEAVSLSVRQGEVLAIVGPNGAGKSTLLRLLAGDTPPSSGELLLDDRPIGSWSLRELARVRAVLLQQTLLQFAFTAEEVVAMARTSAPRGRGSDADTAAIRTAMERTDALHLAERTYPTLSGGEQSRVSLARILAQETPILLLDEPTAALDIRHQQLVMRVARDLAGTGATVVAILHDLNLAAAWADRIAMIGGGRLHGVDTPWRILTEERISHLFECPVAVVPHPLRDHPLVLPVPD